MAVHAISVSRVAGPVASGSVTNLDLATAVNRPGVSFNSLSSVDWKYISVIRAHAR